MKSTTNIHGISQIPGLEGMAILLAVCVTLSNLFLMSVGCTYLFNLYGWSKIAFNSLVSWFLDNI